MSALFPPDEPIIWEAWTEPPPRQPWRAAMEQACAVARNQVDPHAHRTEAFREEDSGTGG